MNRRRWLWDGQHCSGRRESPRGILDVRIPLGGTGGKGHILRLKVGTTA